MIRLRDPFLPNLVFPQRLCQHVSKEEGDSRILFGLLMGARCEKDL